MTGIERIAGAFRAGKKICVMTHVVGGYPGVESCEELVCMMADKGVDLIEVQLPFSDPVADGPVIVQANHAALRAGVTTGAVLAMLERLRKKVAVPLVIMSYVNPLFAYGIDRIVSWADAAGLDGFIVPDCPPEESELRLPALCNGHGLAFVPLIAPTTNPARMAALAAQSASPFVYAVLRLGVTGRTTTLDCGTIGYLDQIRRVTGRYVAAGFGIGEKAQLEALAGHADCGVVGSGLLRAVNRAREEKRDPVKAAEIVLDGLLN